jgi:peroxiredoxin
MEVVDMPEDELQVGSPVPVFKLPSTTGHEVGVTDYAGKKIVLFFVREYN